MATTVVIQLVFLSMAATMLQQTDAMTGGFMLLAIPVNTEKKSNSTEGVCLVRGQPPTRRDDYTYVPGFGGYKLHTRAVLFADARLLCQEEGGHLAIINSVAESAAIALVFEKSEPIVGSRYPDDAYIGFHDLYRQGEYVTIHGESLQKAGYDQWDSGQPNNLVDQDCGGVHRNGRLNDLHCNNEKFGFICEIPHSEDHPSIRAE